MSTLGAVFERIDHIGVAVSDLDAAVELYRDRLGMPLQHRETVEQFGVDAVLLGVGEGHVELLKPTDPDGAIGRFSNATAPGSTTWPTRPKTSTPPWNRRGRPGSGSSTRNRVSGSGKAAWPSCTRESTGGVLTELVQPADGH